MQWQLICFALFLFLWTWKRNLVIECDFMCLNIQCLHIRSNTLIVWFMFFFFKCRNEEQLIHRTHLHLLFNTLVSINTKTWIEHSMQCKATRCNTYNYKKMFVLRKSFQPENLDNKVYLLWKDSFYHIDSKNTMLNLLYSFSKENYKSLPDNQRPFLCQKVAYTISEGRNPEHHHWSLPEFE